MSMAIEEGSGTLLADDNEVLTALVEMLLPRTERIQLILDEILVA